MINCRNCGAPVDPVAIKCPYCDTPYDRPRKTAEAVATVNIDAEAMAKAVDLRLLTTNEARRLLGMREV